MTNSTKPHVVHVLPNYYPAAMTGADRYLSRIAEHLGASGVRSTIITPNVPSARGWYLPTPVFDRFAPEESMNRVRIERLNPFFPLTAAAHLINQFMPHLETTDVRTKATLTERVNAYATGPFFLKLFGRIRALKPTIIHAGPMPLTHVLTTFQIAQRLQIPFVVTPIFHFDMPNYFNPVFTNLLKKADRVIALTEYERTELIQRFSLNLAKVVMVPFGLDIKAIDKLSIATGAFRKKHDINSNQRVILFAGSKGVDKGAIDVLNVVTDLHRDDITLVAIGMPTPSWTKMLTTTQPRNLVDLGYITEQEKWEAFRDCDIVTVPGRALAFGLFFLEGWKFKKAVVGPIVGAASEIVQDGVNGYLVPFGDRVALKQRLVELIDDPAKAKQLGVAGYQRLAAYTDTAMGQAVKKVFTPILNESVQPVAVA